MLSSPDLRAARLVPEDERERRNAGSVAARALAEAIFRDLAVRIEFLNDDAGRWREAKRLTKKRLFL